MSDPDPSMSACPQDRRAMIAIDLGAESCRVSLLRWLNDSPHIELVHRHAHAPVNNNGEIRWDLRQIMQQMDAGLRKCADIATEGIRSIAADGWAVDYVRLNQNGEPLAEPFCYRDERTIRSQPEVYQRISAAHLRTITGIEMSRINTLYQLCADADDLQDKPWLTLPEYTLHRLGGRAVAEYTNATHTQLVDAEKRSWSPEIFAAVGLVREAAAPIVGPGTVIGKLKGRELNLLGLDGAELIAPACHDTASAIAGIADSGDDWAYISSGTWSLVGTTLKEPINGEAAQTANFTNLGAVGGRICFHKNVNGMWMLRQCMTEWAAEIDWTVPELIAAAEHLSPPAALLNVDDPDLLLPGEMPARMNRQLKRRGLQPLAEGAEAAPAMTSLILHSLAARYGEIVSSLGQITGKKLRRIYIVGGGSRNTLLNRLTEAATGLEVRCGAVESATIGNFSVQLAALENPQQDGVGVAAVAHWAQQILSGIF
jgi:rhamnulokinase